MVAVFLIKIFFCRVSKKERNYILAILMSNEQLHIRVELKWSITQSQHFICGNKSQSFVNHFFNYDVIKIRLGFHTHKKNKNAKALKIHSVILLITLRLCNLFPTVKLTIAIFKRSFLVKYTKYAYIHAQQVEISKNRHFVFGFTSLLFLTFFSTVILTGS